MLTEMLGHDSKSDTGKTLRFWVKSHKIEEFYQLLLWDVDDFTDHGALSSYMDKAQAYVSPQEIHTIHLFPSTSRYGFGP